MRSRCSGSQSNGSCGNFSDTSGRRRGPSRVSWCRRWTSRGLSRVGWCRRRSTRWVNSFARFIRRHVASTGNIRWSCRWDGIAVIKRRVGLTWLAVSTNSAIRNRGIRGMSKGVGTRGKRVMRSGTGTRRGRWRRKRTLGGVIGCIILPNATRNTS